MHRAVLIVKIECTVYAKCDICTFFAPALSKIVKPDIKAFFEGFLREGRKSGEETFPP